MKISSKSIGYRTLENLIGEGYAEVLYDIASTNARNYLYIPIYIERASSRIKHALPEAVLMKIINAFGGERLIVKKESIKRDNCALKRQAAITLVQCGYSVHQVSIILNVKENTVRDKYFHAPYEKTVDNNCQLSLF